MRIPFRDHRLAPLSGMPLDETYVYVNIISNECGDNVASVDLPGAAAVMFT
jgi:hypothetical protein